MIFKFLLRLYPPRFRRRFDGEMRRFYEEARQNERPISLWPGLITDTAVHPTAEWVRVLLGRSLPKRDPIHTPREPVMNSVFPEIRQTVRTLWLAGASLVLAAVAQWPPGCRRVVPPASIR